MSSNGGADKPHDTDPQISDPGTADTQAPDTGPTTPDAAAAVAGATKGPRQIRTGDVLDDRYEIFEELGEGGMATVFRARDRQLRRDVAVKVLFPHLARRTEVVRRFHREARAAAGLEHPNILRIYDVGGGDPAGTADDFDPPYIVMELIRGRTLLQEIEQRDALLAEIAACIGALLADALGAAHRAGIIHRDIKPSNVLIAQGGRLLLADFGVARLETEDSLVTRTGSLLGTPAYMSPEQASGDTATAKSDLYSLGATLYQLSTALLPYSGSPAKVMSQIAAGLLVAPVKRRASVGPDLSRTIERLMETEPAQRPADASTVAADLRKLAAQAGFGDPTEELAAYFEDPAGFLAKRRPAVVASIVATAKQAIAEGKLPRAMALADRASHLAPDDPAVKTLVETVTAGAGASARRRLVLVAGAGVLVAGAGVAGVLALRGGSGGSPDAAAPIADASVALHVDDAPADPIDTVVAIAEIDAAVPAQLDAAPLPLDAAVRPKPDAMTAPRDATPMLATQDAPEPDAPPPAIDAAPVIGDGTVLLLADSWCYVTVDGDDVGRTANNKKTLTLHPGKHVITCAKKSPPEPKAWRQDVDVVAGQQQTVSASLLQPVEVVIGVGEIQINGVHYPRNHVVKLLPNRYTAVVTGGSQGYLQINGTVARCTVHDTGTEIVCDP